MLVQNTIDAIRQAVEKRVLHLKMKRLMAEKCGDRPTVDVCRGGIDELEFLISHFPEEK